MEFKFIVGILIVLSIFMIGCVQQKSASTDSGSNTDIAQLKTELNQLKAENEKLNQELIKTQRVVMDNEIQTWQWFQDEEQLKNIQLGNIQNILLDNKLTTYDDIQARNLKTLNPIGDINVFLKDQGRDFYNSKYEIFNNDDFDAWKQSKSLS